MDGEERNPQEPSTQSALQKAAKYTFFGSYAHGIDSKGRMIVPNAYRSALGESFVLGPTRDFQGIALYPNETYGELLEDLVSMNRRKPVVQQYVTQFAKLSYRDVQADGQGRVLLPAKLRQRMLGEAKELEISGAMDHIRVVDNLKAETEDTAFMDDLKDILQQLGNEE